jgi:hypothetical protein
VSDQARTGRTAARHARLAYTIASKLQELSPETTVVPDTESGEISIGRSYLPADFVVQHLDLRIRLVALLKATGPDELLKSEYLEGAELLLRHWPETSAVALVANDKELSCVILEPYDASSAIVAPSGQMVRPRATHRPLPIVMALQEYLDTRIPSWQVIPRLPEEQVELDLSAVATHAAQVAATGVHRAGSRAQRDEKREAFREVGEADIAWAVALVERVLSGKLTSDEAAHELDRRAEQQ